MIVDAPTAANCSPHPPKFIARACSINGISLPTHVPHARLLLGGGKSQQRLEPTLLLLEDRVGRTGQHDHFARPHDESATFETGTRQRNHRFGDPFQRIDFGRVICQHCACRENRSHEQRLENDSGSTHVSILRCQERVI